MLKKEKAIDFEKIYEYAEKLFCENNGRQSIAPVVLFKILLIQHIYAIPSLRKMIDSL